MIRVGNAGEWFTTPTIVDVKMTFDTIASSGHQGGWNITVADQEQYAKSKDGGKMPTVQGIEGH